MKSKKGTSTETDPIEVTEGSVSLKIYVGKNRVGRFVYPQYTLVYYSGNQRVKRRFADLDEAKREGHLVALKLANGENEVLKLTSTDRAVYIQALDAIRPFNLPLNHAVVEYAEARKLLPPNVSLREAVLDFARRYNSVRESKTVPQLVKEYIATKERAGKSQAHLRDIRLRMTRFGEKFGLSVAQLTGPMLQQWLDGLKVSNRTKVNELRHVTSLLNFAVRRK